MAEERRLVTVLFADVTGSTALAEALDPEDMRGLLGQYFAIAREVLTEHGGTLEKFIGDAVMAVFGLPTAHDDDAARAAAAALSLRDRVRSEPGLGDRLPIRLGLSTGEVVASVGLVERPGTSDFLVTGDAVNVAARLQQSAGSWEIWCSDRTARATGDNFVFGPAREIEVRGKAAPLLARTLERVAPERARARTPFLGRDADLAQLELTAGRAVRERRPFLVTITAPAGIGKTRLVEEFLERLPDKQPGVRVLAAQCLPYGQRLTYWPLHALLRQLLDLPDDSELDQLRRAAQAWLAAAGDAAPQRTAELLAATFGAGEGEPIDRAELFAAWRAAIELAARQQPLVMVVEDLHWSSDSLLDLIEGVLQPRGDVPLLMIVLARPELLDRRPTWGGGRRNYVAISLEPLDDLAIGALVHFLLGGPPDHVVQVVLERAGGNPFFAGELARTIRERATSLDDPAAVEAVITSLPDTVHATVLSRLDLLPGTPRRVLQLGSVLGRSFRVAGVTALAPNLLEEADAGIDHLLEHELLQTAGAGEYTFRHILIREVAYQTLPRAERARMHAGAGVWLEETAAGHEMDRAELIAFHYREAVNLTTTAGADLDPALVDKAVTWLRRAADAAIAGAAFEEAGRHLRAAIEIAPREQLPELWADAGDIFGGGAIATDAYATAARLGRELGRPADFILRVLSGRLMVLCRWAGSVGAEFDAEEMDRLLVELRSARENATERLGIGYSLVAESFVALGSLTGGVRQLSPAEIEAARGLAQQAAAIARGLDDATLLSAALDALGTTTVGRDPNAGLELTLQRVAMEERLAFGERCDVHNMLAWHNSALGNLAAVLEAADELLRDMAPNQALALALSLIAWKVWALVLLGRWDEVAQATERAIRAWEEAGRISAGFALQGFMAAAEVGWARGDDRLASRATSVLIGISDQFPPGQMFRRLAAFAAPDPAALVREVVLAWEHFVNRLHLVERVVSLCVDRREPIPAEALDNLIGEMRARDQRLLLAQLLRARGVQARSADDLREALDLFRSFHARPSIARAEVELGQLSGDSALETSGIRTLETLGDVGQLGRVASATR